MSALIVEALKMAKRANALALKAYSIDTAQPGSTSNVFTGTASAFTRLGFKTVARGPEALICCTHHLQHFGAVPFFGEGANQRFDLPLNPFGRSSSAARMALLESFHESP